MRVECKEAVVTTVDFTLTLNKEESLMLLEILGNSSEFSVKAMGTSVKSAQFVYPLYQALLREAQKVGIDYYAETRKFSQV